MFKDSDARSSPKIFGVLVAGVFLLNMGSGGGGFDGGRSGGGGAGGIWGSQLSWAETSPALPTQSAQVSWDVVDASEVRTTSAGAGNGHRAGGSRDQR